MMDFTVSSPGEPHRDCWAKPAEANLPRNKSASRDDGMIDANFITLNLLICIFTGIPEQGFSSLKTKTPLGLHPEKTKPALSQSRCRYRD
jgi:hypothetical protein